MGEDFKNEIRIYNSNKNYKMAMKLLNKYRIENYVYLESSSDKFFLDYCLALHNYRDVKNNEIANMYLRCIKELFKTEDDIIENEDNYIKYLWLNININHKEMTKSNILLDMFKVYNYYYSNGMYDIAMTARETISFHLLDEEGMLTSLSNLLEMKISDEHLIDSILRDCENVSSNLYIKALHIVKKRYTATEDVVKYN